MQKRFIISCVSFNTRFGWLTLETTTNGLERVRFGKFCEEPCLSGDTALAFLEKVKSAILNYLQGKKVGAIHELSLQLNNLTPIQIKVFKELSKVRYSETISYKELAHRIGTSPRACGRILAGNPFPIIIPCHRVICANGSLGGYTGGINWKKKLLKLEGCHISKL